MLVRVLASGSKMSVCLSHGGSPGAAPRAVAAGARPVHGCVPAGAAAPCTPTGAGPRHRAAQHRRRPPAADVAVPAAAATCPSQAEKKENGSRDRDDGCQDGGLGRGWRRPPIGRARRAAARVAHLCGRPRIASAAHRYHRGVALRGGALRDGPGQLLPVQLRRVVRGRRGLLRPRVRVQRERRAVAARAASSATRALT